MAYALLDRLPARPMHVVCDPGYAGYAFREHVRQLGAKPTIPSRRTDPDVRCDDCIYRNRNVVERLWGRLKQWRAIATRYEKTATSFIGVLQLAAACDRLKD